MRRRRSNPLRTNPNEQFLVVDDDVTNQFNTYVNSNKRNKSSSSADAEIESTSRQEHTQPPQIFQQVNNNEVSEQWPYLAPHDDDNNHLPICDTPEDEERDPTAEEASALNQQNTAGNITLHHHTSIPTVHNIDSSANYPYIVAVFRKGLKYAASWANILSFLCVHGRSRVSREIYILFQELLSNSKDDKQLMAYSSARGVLSSYFNGHCFPRGSIYYFKCENILKKTSINEAPTIQTAVGDKRDARECVKIILPSSWAKYDVALHPTYNDIIVGEHHRNDAQISIEDSPLVNDRRHFVGNSKSFWAVHKGVIVNVDSGTRIKIVVDVDPSLRSSNAFNEILFAGYDFYQKENDPTYFHCFTGPQWCVSTPNFIDSEHTDIDTSTLSAEEIKVWTLFRVSTKEIKFVKEPNKTSKNTGQNQNRKDIHKPQINSKVQLYPTDICTFLRPKNEYFNGRFVCIFVSSYASNITSMSSERILWIDTTDDRNKGALENLDPEEPFFFYISIDVTAVPTVHTHNKKEIRGQKKQRSSPAGTLADGTPYVVYRFALYADEFGYDGVCGIYILLLGAAQHNRVSSAGVRVLSLVPKHQNVNKVLKIILDDVMFGTVYGIAGKDPFGNNIKIFLDMPGVFGDYIKMSAITNSAGHSATCFCTYCKTRKNTSTTAPSYAYSTTTHCRRLGFMRCDERLNILTSMNLTEDSRRHLGLKVSSAEAALRLPMVYYSDGLKKLFKTFDNQVPTPFHFKDKFFDSTLCTAVAPDHLITGLILVLLQACFVTLPNNRIRRSIEEEILLTAVDNSLPTQGHFLGFHSSGTFEGLKSMTMSTLYVVLLCASPILYELKGTSLDTKGIFHIPSILQEFISTLYFWPDITVDSFEESDFVVKDNHHYYLQRLQKLAAEYTDEVGKHIRKYGVLSVLSDRPNSHRLLELAVHTIPLFGHGKLTSELVLELTHAFFKSWFKECHHASSHITAVDLFLSRIWSVNVFLLHHMWKNGTSDEQTLAFSNLLFLFFGDATRFIDANSLDDLPHIESLLEKFATNIDDIMIPPVPRLLSGSIPVSMMLDKIEWVPTHIEKKPKINYITSMAIDIFKTKFQTTYQALTEEMLFFKRAALTAFGKYGSVKRTYPYKTIYRGTPIRVHVEDETMNNLFIDKIHNGHSKRILLVVHDIIQYKNKQYIAGCDLEEHKKEDEIYFKVKARSVRIIPLEPGITRLGYVERRTHSSFNEGSNFVRGGIFGGGLFRLMFRSTGYPPCLG